MKIAFLHSIYPHYILTHRTEKETIVNYKFSTILLKLLLKLQSNCALLQIPNMINQIIPKKFQIEFQYLNAGYMNMKAMIFTNYSGNGTSAKHIINNAQKWAIPFS